MKKINLFPKIFAYTVFMMLLIIVIAFLLLHLLVPPLYQSMKAREMTRKVDSLIAELDGQDRGSIISSVQNFVSENRIYGTLTDSSGQLLFQSVYGFAYSMGESNQADKKEESETVIETVYDSIDYVREAYDYSGEQYSLRLTMSLQPVNEASRVILMAVPIAISICLAVSVLLAFLFSNHITVPIRGISVATTKMLSLDKDLRCTVKSKDEIGVLADNVNHLYTSLLNSIESLKKEISEREETEKNKLDFLRALSHELKTPITAIRGMLEGMMHDVGIYKDHTRYIAECNRQIGAMSALIQSVLDTARFEISGAIEEVNISDIVSDLLSPFLIISQANGIDLKTNIETPITVNAEKAVLSKAISNILSNAVNYTPSGGTVSIRTVDNALIIENDCVPLTPDQLKSIFGLFYRPDFSRKREDGSNGMGLYLVNRILKIYGYQYEFKPLSDNSGMAFTIWFDE
jgi:signal transduction histidine kinase